MVQKGGGGFSDSKEGEGLTVLPTGIYSLLYSTLLAIVVVVVVVTSYLAASFFFFFFSSSLLYDTRYSRLVL